MRYDGTDKLSSLCTELLAQYFELQGICPEVEAGMAVPRPPIQLVQSQQGLVVLQRDDHQQGHTQQLASYSAAKVEQLEHLSGYVLTQRSPSCGVGSVPLYSEEGEVLQKVNGVFVDVLLTAYPHLPVIEEQTLHSSAELEQFIVKVRKYAQRLKRGN